MDKGKLTFSLKLFLLSMAITAAVAYGLSRLIHFNFWAVWAIVVLAMLLNGWIAEAEDNLPGGFNNPTEEQRAGRKGGKKVLANGYAIAAGIILAVALAALIFFGRQGLGGGVLGFGILMLGVFMALAVLVTGWINTRNGQRSDKAD